MTDAEKRLEELMRYVLISEYGGEALDDGVEYIFRKTNHSTYKEIENLTARFGFTMDFAKDALEKFVNETTEKIKKGE